MIWLLQRIKKNQKKRKKIKKNKKWLKIIIIKMIEKMINEDEINFLKDNEGPKAEANKTEKEENKMEIIY